MICNKENCTKKIKSVYPINCKCKLYFCKNHKYPEKHDCTYNYEKTYQENLKKENEKVVAEKVQNI